MPLAYIWTKDKFDGPMFGGIIFGRKKHFHLRSVKLTFLFSSRKHVCWHFSRRARCEIIKTVKDSNKTIEVNNKYIRDVHWVTYLGGVYSEGGDLYTEGVLTGFQDNFIF